MDEKLGPHGITSNVVHPGATRGDWLKRSLASRAAARGVSEAELEAELASPLSGAVTGESIGTGGGMSRMVTI
jgi:NAD(P)-dependent dehydrogenase (short-subunit alcohol dehydrogenase family)